MLESFLGRGGWRSPPAPYHGDGEGLCCKAFLRRFIISLSKAGWARRMVTGWGFAWRFASRFVAGQTLEQAIAVAQDLNLRGITVSLDHLGENTTQPDEARQAAEDVIQALEAIDASGVRANISLKLTQLGLVLDEPLCRENLRRILERARMLGIFVRIDMEDSPFTERTLQMYDWARDQGFDNRGRGNPVLPVPQ